VCNDGDNDNDAADFIDLVATPPKVCNDGCERILDDTIGHRR
jgi:hypothetical protein